MESPQLENGYTRIANEIYDAFCKIRISGEERQVLDCILRKTYGWNKCEDAISLSQFESMTGIQKPHIIRAINGLLSKNMISVANIGNNKTKVYKFIKDYSIWRSLPKKATLPKMATTIAKNGNNSLPKMVPTKDTIKDNTKDNTKKPKKLAVEKIKFKDSVFLTQQEIEKLQSKFSNGDFEKAIDILNNYKMSKGVKYKSDYHVLIGWVSDRMAQIKPIYDPFKGAL